MASNWKRMLTFVLAFAMLVSMMSISVSAKTTGAATTLEASSASETEEAAEASVLDNLGAAELTLNESAEVVISASGEKVYFIFTPERQLYLHL